MSPAPLTRPAWTEEHESTVRKMRAAGSSASAIARQITEDGLPVSRNAVLGKIHRLGLSAPAVVEPAVAPQAAAVVEGMTPPAPPVTEPVEALPFTRPAGRLLLDLPAHGCRYAVGQDASGRHLFCGEPITRKSWCAACADIVFAARDMGGMSLAQARASGRLGAEGSRRG